MSRRLTAYVSRDFDQPDGAVVRVTASTPSVDRYGDIVDQSWQLDPYRANPVVLWGHDASELPIGRALSVGVEGGSLVADIELDTGSARGSEVLRLVRAGVLSTVSVGWLPGRSTPRSTLDEHDARRGASGYVHEDNELLEISFVSVPGNAGATVQRDIADLPALVAEAVAAYLDAQPGAARPSTPSRNWREMSLTDCAGLTVADLESDHE